MGNCRVTWPYTVLGQVSVQTQLLGCPCTRTTWSVTLPSRRPPTGVFWRRTRSLWLWGRKVRLCRLESPRSEVWVMSWLSAGKLSVVSFPYIPHKSKINYLFNSEFNSYLKKINCVLFLMRKLPTSVSYIIFRTSGSLSPFHNIWMSLLCGNSSHPYWLFHRLTYN